MVPSASRSEVTRDDPRTSIAAKIEAPVAIQTSASNGVRAEKAPAVTGGSMGGGEGGAGGSGGSGACSVGSTMAASLSHRFCARPEPPIGPAPGEDCVRPQAKKAAGNRGVHDGRRQQ